MGDDSHRCNDSFLYVPPLRTVFLGERAPRAGSHSEHNTPHGNLEAAPCRPHESPLAMTFPLMFLAVVTCGAGFIPFGHFISSNGESYSIHLDPSVAITSVVIAIISIAIANMDVQECQTGLLLITLDKTIQRSAQGSL